MAHIVCVLLNKVHVDAQPDNDLPSWSNMIESRNPDELALGQTETQYPCDPSINTTQPAFQNKTTRFRPGVKGIVHLFSMIHFNNELSFLGERTQM